MARPRLHLDADTSRKDLYRALRARGHDVSRTPSDWMPGDASDEEQLLGATAQGRCLCTFDVRDLLVLSQVYPHHAGIILAFQGSWTIAELIAALDRLLSSTSTDDWRDTVRWLNEWR